MDKKNSNCDGRPPISFKRQSPLYSSFPKTNKRHNIKRKYTETCNISSVPTLADMSPMGSKVHLRYESTLSFSSSFGDSENVDFLGGYDFHKSVCAELERRSGTHYLTKEQINGIRNAFKDSDSFSGLTSKLFGKGSSRNSELEGVELRSVGTSTSDLQSPGTDILSDSSSHQSPETNRPEAACIQDETHDAASSVANNLDNSNSKLFLLQPNSENKEIQLTVLSAQNTQISNKASTKSLAKSIIHVVDRSKETSSVGQSNNEFIKTNKQQNQAKEADDTLSIDSLPSDITVEHNLLGYDRQEHPLKKSLYHTEARIRCLVILETIRGCGKRIRKAFLRAKKAFPLRCYCVCVSGQQEGDYHIQQ